MEILKKYGSITLAAILGVLVGRYVLKPKTKVEVKEKTVFVEVFKEKKEENKKIKTIKTEKIKPDGSKEIVTEISEDFNSITQTDKNTKLELEKSKIAKAGSGITLSLLGIKDIPNPSKPFEYGIVVSAPIMGNLNVTGMVTTEKQVGIGLGISF